MSPEPRPPGGDADGPVPVFGTWPAIYLAVLLCAVLVMGLVALFSRWAY